MINEIHHHPGTLEIITGCMFSGKSEELIKRLKRAVIAKQKVKIFKPRLDNRYNDNLIVSHSQMTIPSILIDKAEDILAHIEDDTQVVGIDEIQFLGEGAVAVCSKLADSGIRVICAGLDLDYKGRPFKPVPELLAVADYITKQLAICVKCGSPASRTQRLIKSAELIVVGAEGAYEARCRKCHEVFE